jgi:hypothetical protein
MGPVLVNKDCHPIRGWENLGFGLYGVVYRINTATFSLFFSKSSGSVEAVPIIVAGLRTQRGELELSATSATDIGSDDPRFIIGDP